MIPNSVSTRRGPAARRVTAAALAGAALVVLLAGTGAVAPPAAAQDDCVGFTCDAVLVDDHLADDALPTPPPPAVEEVGPSPADFVDTDRDGLYDDDEVNVYGTKPNEPDTDRDGIDDGQEVHQGTDPTIDNNVVAVDSDGDGLVDWDEVVYGTDRTRADTDHDCLYDGTEVARGTRPLDYDTDGDGGGDGIDEEPLTPAPPGTLWTQVYGACPFGP